MKVAVIGASDKPDRYSYRAVMLLMEMGHRVFPVHNSIKKIDGLKVYRSVADIEDDIDTITIYVSAAVSDGIAGEIIAKKPKRIILNPGAENDGLELEAKKAGIETINACTLVMLKTGQF